MAQINVSTFAGLGSGYADGTGTAARFKNPFGVAVDVSGTVYVADEGNHKIRKITPSGDVTTFAGSTIGYADGIGTAAKFIYPTGVAVDASGNVYVAEQANHKIRKITPTGEVSTFAGSIGGYADGTGTAARFNNPYGVAVDTSGNVYVADESNHKIRKITPDGVVTTFAGSTAGYADGTGTAAQFYFPTGLAVDDSGNVYVADYNNNRIRKITSTGVVTTLAGGTQGSADGTGTAAQFNHPKGIALDASGNVYVADYDSNRIRKITPIGEVTTLAGSTYGFVDGTGTEAKFRNPTGLAIDNASGIMYIADYNNHRIRKIVDTSLSTSLHQALKFEIYPNPSNGVFNIKNFTGNTFIEVFDIYGKKILFYEVNSGKSILNLSNYASGIYFVKFTNENNQTNTIKLIKVNY
ncbi:NHL domain-containing protein [Polaribacter sp.]